MSINSAAPRTVLAAGILVGLQGLAGLAYAAVLALRVGQAAARPGNVYAEAGYFLVLAAAVLAVAVGLLSGRRWSRTPATVLQLLLLGVGWYVIGPSGQVAAGIAVVAWAVAVLVLLFTARGRAWAVGAPDPAAGPNPAADAGQRHSG